MNLYPKFLDKIPSLVTEAAISAPLTVAGALLAAWACQFPLGLGIVCTLMSLVYERYMDANGFSWKDILQRQVGIVVLVLLYAILKGPHL